MNNKTNRKTVYRVVMTCWDQGAEYPYSDFITRMFDTEDDAIAAIRAAIKDELELLNEREIEEIDIEYPSETDAFKADFDGDEFTAIVRYWEGEDYWPVTGYKIYKVEPIWERSWSYRRTDNHAFILCVNEKANRFMIQLADETLCVRHSLLAALDYIDDFLMECQNAETKAKKFARNYHDEHEWTIPVTWEVCGFVKVKGKTMRDAIETFERDVDHIPLPKESTYVDGSFALTSGEEEFIRLYNKQKYELVLCKDEPEVETVYALLDPEQVTLVEADIAGMLQSGFTICLTDGRNVDTGIIDEIRKV